jgi:hypothetical protein
LPHFFTAGLDDGRVSLAATLALDVLLGNSAVDNAGGAAVLRLTGVIVQARPSPSTAAFLTRAMDVRWSDADFAQRFYTHACASGLFRQARLGLDSPDAEVAAASGAVISKALATAEDRSIFRYFAHDILTGPASHAILGCVATPTLFGTLLATLVGDPSALRPLVLDSDPSRATWLLAHIVDISLNDGQPGEGGAMATEFLSRISAESLGHLVELVGELLPVVPQAVFVDPVEADDEEDDDMNDMRWGVSAAATAEAQVLIVPAWRGLRRLVHIGFTREVVKLLRSSVRPTDVESVCRLVNLTLDRCSTALQRAMLLSVVAFEPGLVVHLWGLISSRHELLDQFVAGALEDYGETVSYARLFAGAYVAPAPTPPCARCAE